MDEHEMTRVEMDFKYDYINRGAILLTITTQVILSQFLNLTKEKGEN